MFKNQLKDLNVRPEIMFTRKKKKHRKIKAS